MRTDTGLRRVEPCPGRRRDRGAAGLGRPESGRTHVQAGRQVAPALARTRRRSHGGSRPGTPPRTSLTSPGRAREKSHPDYIRHHSSRYAKEQPLTGSVRSTMGRRAGRVDTARAGPSGSLHRDDIVEAIAFAAERLLAATDWREAADDVLARLGEAADVSRAYIATNGEDGQGRLTATWLAEWTPPGVLRVMDDPEFRSAPWEESGFGRWAEVLGNGEVVQGAVAGFPERERLPLELHGVVSLVEFPVFVGDAWWGCIGFDDCVQVRDWSGEELAALRASATVLGAAIHRRLADGPDRPGRGPVPPIERTRARGDVRGRPRWRRVACRVHRHAGRSAPRLSARAIRRRSPVLAFGPASRRSRARDRRKHQAVGPRVRLRDWSTG